MLISIFIAFFLGYYETTQLTIFTQLFFKINDSMLQNYLCFHAEILLADCVSFNECIHKKNLPTSDIM